MRKQKRLNTKPLLVVGIVILLLFGMIFISSSENLSGKAASLLSKVKITIPTKTSAPVKTITTPKVTLPTTPKVITPKKIASLPQANTQTTPPLTFTINNPHLDSTLIKQSILLYCKDNTFNFFPNMLETDKDCGGPACPKCPNGRKCQQDNDCQSGVCSRRYTTLRGGTSDEQVYSEFVCVPPSCSDHIQNQNERGIDCGGPCQKGCSNCSDTDGGFNIFLRGTVTDLFGSNATDSCTSRAIVHEIGCDAKGYLDARNVTCPAQTTICNEGSCTPINTCSDPDGIDTHNATSAVAISLANGFSSTIKTDVCLNPTTLNEGVCSGTNAVFQSIHCATNELCQNGACSPLTCDDPDARNIHQKTIANDSTGNRYEDSCSGTQVLEGICTNNIASTELISCPIGETCVQGICIASGSCTDDDQRNTSRATSAIDSTGHQEIDECFSSTVVSEGICNLEHHAIKENIPCAENEICTGGICIAEDFCDQPHDGGTYPDSTLIETTEGFHLNKCTEDLTVLDTIICRWGEIHVGKTVCQNGCFNGTCRDQPDTCSDSDPQNNPRQPGQAMWSEWDYNRDYCQGWEIVKQVNCPSHSSSINRYLWNDQECALNELCIPGWRNGMCRRVSTICNNYEESGLPGKKVKYHDLDTGEIFTHEYTSQCDLNNAPPNGPQRPVMGRRVSCRQDTSRPVGAQDILTTEDFNCTSSEICIFGECKPNTYTPEQICNDTDGGINLGSRGFISGVSTPFGYVDGCVNGDFSDQVFENWCGPEGLWKSEAMNCPSGTKCVNGACLACYDSDRYNSQSEVGFVRYASGEQQYDVCLGEGSDILLQYDCNADTGVFTEVPFNCTDYGRSCRNGKCVGN